MPAHTKPDNCSICGAALDDTNWSRYRRTHRDLRCRTCITSYHMKRYRRDPAYKEYMKAAAIKHYHTVQKARFQALRQETVAAYGGKCACCGETDWHFLVIDHVHNDGKAHRHHVGGGSQVMNKWLKSHGWPREGFQLLCANCNQGRAWFGVCPHELRLRVVK